MPSGDYGKLFSAVYHAKVVGGPDFVTARDAFKKAASEDAELRSTIAERRALMTDDVVKRDFIARVMRPVLDEILEA